MIKEHFLQKVKQSGTLDNNPCPFLPTFVVDQVLSDLGIQDNDSESTCVVWYSLEFAVALRLRGFSNVTLITKDVSNNTHKMVTMKEFGLSYEYATIEDIMKRHFDYGVGNPPYTDGSKGNANVWPEHSKNVLAIADKVGWVIPASIGLGDKSGNGSARAMFKEHGLKKFVFLPWDTFGKNATVTPCYLISERGHTGQVEVNDVYGNTYSDNSGYFISHGIVSGIVDKLPRNDPYKFIKVKGKEDIHDHHVTGTVKCTDIVTKITNTADIITEPRVCYQKDADKYRVLTSYQNNGPNCKNYHGDMIHLKAVQVLEPGVAVKNNYMYIPCDTEAEAEVIVSYLQTNLCNAIWAYTRTTRTLDAPQIRWIPKLNSTKKVTDEDLIKMFKLTSAEADFVRDFYTDK